MHVCSDKVWLCVELVGLDMCNECECVVVLFLLFSADVVVITV